MSQNGLGWAETAHLVSAVTEYESMGKYSTFFPGKCKAELVSAVTYELKAWCALGRRRIEEGLILPGEQKRHSIRGGT